MNVCGPLTIQTWGTSIQRKTLGFSFQWVVRTSWVCMKAPLTATLMPGTLLETICWRHIEFLEYEPQVPTNFLQCQTRFAHVEDLLARDALALGTRELMKLDIQGASN